MRGSQRARDILTAMGKDAFKWYDTVVGFGPRTVQRKQRPLGGRQIAQLKKEFRLDGKCASKLVRKVLLEKVIL
jgi:hypothetical protein